MDHLEDQGEFRGGLMMILNDGENATIYTPFTGPKLLINWIVHDAMGFSSNSLSIRMIIHFQSPP